MGKKTKNKYLSILHQIALSDITFSTSYNQSLATEHEQWRHCCSPRPLFLRQGSPKTLHFLFQSCRQQLLLKKKVTIFCHKRTKAEILKKMLAFQDPYGRLSTHQTRPKGIRQKRFLSLLIRFSCMHKTLNYNTAYPHDCFNHKLKTVLS